MVVHEPTGYLESQRIDRLPAELKAQIVDIYRQTGNLYQACRTLGVDTRLLRRHKAQDEQFAADLAEVEWGFVETMKGYMLGFASNPKCFNDRIAIARRFEPGQWGNQINVDVKHSLERVETLGQKASEYHAKRRGELDGEVTA